MPHELITDERLEMRSPVKPTDVVAITAKVKIVQFSRPPGEPDYVALGKAMRNRPDVWLRPYSWSKEAFEGLEFLRHFPGLRKFDLGVGLADLRSLFLLPAEITHLSLENPRDKTFSFGDLHRFRRLESFALDGKLKHPEQVAGLRSLVGLTLRGVPLQDVNVLRGLPKLRGLHLSGGAIDVAPLGEFPLQYLKLGRLSRLEDVSFLGVMAELRALEMYWQRQVRAFPDMGGCARLKAVHLDTFNGLEDVRGFLKAPGLAEFQISGGPALGVASLNALSRATGLKHLYVSPKGPKRPGKSGYWGTLDREYERCRLG